VTKGASGNINTTLTGNVPFGTATGPDASNASGNMPKAYFTILFFDERFNFIEENSTSRRVATAGDGATALTLANIKAPKNGYAYIYVSNESAEPVYFDNIQVTHEHKQIIEEDHYYSYGLKIAAISSRKLGDPNEGQLRNNYLYQGDYSEYDEDIAWNDFALRSYDPQIGRFVNIDPYDQFASPYVGMGNEPVDNVDPSGGWTLASITGSTNVFFNTAVTTIAGGLIGGIVDFATGGNGKGALIGAGIGFSTGLGISIKANINALFDIFRNTFQKENRIIGRTLNDLSDNLIDAETKLNRRNAKDKEDFKNHFGVDDDATMNGIKSVVLTEQKRVKYYLRKKTYRNKIKHTHKYDDRLDLQVVARTNPDDLDYNVGLEHFFWELPRIGGENSKLSTLAHELSHFKENGPLNHHPTGSSGVKAASLRARVGRRMKDPFPAEKNSYNFGYYIAKIRLP
jgi:RHS repeat-associated protein